MNPFSQQHLSDVMRELENVIGELETIIDAPALHLVSNLKQEYEKLKAAL